MYTVNQKVHAIYDLMAPPNDKNWNSQKYYYYRRPIGDPTETDMPYRRPTCLILRPTCVIGDMPDWRPTCLIGDRHVSLETHRRLTCLIGDSFV